MELMGIIAVIVNLALLGMGGSLDRMFPNMTAAQRVLLIIVVEVDILDKNLVPRTFAAPRKGSRYNQSQETEKIGSCLKEYFYNKRRTEKLKFVR